MHFQIYYTVKVDTVYEKVLNNSYLLLFYVMEFRRQINIFCTSEALLCFTQKNNFCIMNKIKLVWFYSLYRNYFFEQKCDLFIYFKKYFLPCHTLENISRILNNSVYFQNIVVCNKPFKKNLISITFSIEKHNLRAKSLILIVPCTRS